MRLLILMTACLVSDGLMAAAQQQNTQSEDEAAIRRSIASYIEAFNNRDAQSLAVHWAPNGVYLDRTTGEKLTGREAILKRFSEVFAEKTSPTLEVTVDSIRQITPKVAIEEGTAQVLFPGEPPEKTTYTAIHVKENGKWLLDSVRETLVPPPTSHYVYLKDLEWMVGTWVDQDENATIETRVSWTTNRNFLTRSFTVSVENRTELEGTQIIGWDPIAETIRCWVFDTDGGFAEGEWTRQSDGWQIALQAKLPGGIRASAVNVIKQIDENSFTWSQVNREQGGKLLPNIEEVTVVRAPE